MQYVTEVFFAAKEANDPLLAVLVTPKYQPVVKKYKMFIFMLGKTTSSRNLIRTGAMSAIFFINFSYPFAYLVTTKSIYDRLAQVTYPNSYSF